MFSFNYVVNILMCVLYMTVHEGIGIKITDSNTIRNNIIKYINVEAYTSIKLEMGKSEDPVISKYKLVYNYNDKLESKLLEEDSENDLLKIRDVVYSHIHCTYITGTYKILLPLETTFKKIKDMTTGKLDNIKALIGIVEKSNTLWKKAMRTLQLLDIDPSYVLWQVLIFSNTSMEILSKTYSGMNTTTEDDAIIQRIANVFQQIINSLYSEIQECNKEQIGFYETAKDTTQYPEDITKPIECPTKDNELSILCSDSFKYVTLFEKLLYKNHLGNLPYTGYENFDPNNWLLTAPNLEKKMEQGSTYLHFTFTDADKKMDDVNSISNDDWALNYSKPYFESVYRVLDPFRKLSLQLMTQNLNICHNYWRTIQYEVLNNENLFTKIVGYCNDIKSKTGKIIENVIMNDDQLLAAYEGWKKTFDAELEYEVTYDNAFQDVHAQKISVWFGTEFNFGNFYLTLFKDIEKKISSITTDLSTINNINIGILNMFKRSVFKGSSVKDEK